MKTRKYLSMLLGFCMPLALMAQDIQANSKITYLTLFQELNN